MKIRGAASAEFCTPVSFYWGSNESSKYSGRKKLQKYEKVKFVMTERAFNNKPEEHLLRLFLVRHGETDANLNHLIQGTSDGPLNKTGITQAAKLGQFLKHVHFDHIYASDLKRAKDTAAMVAGYHNLSVEIDLRLREWDCGELDGMPASVFLNMIKETGKPISLFVPPGGETVKDVRFRADSLLADLKNRHMGEAVLLCAHGDIMRMIFSCLLNIGIDEANAFYFNNASYSILEFNGEGWKLLATNRVPADCD
jgi:broad specificity phosphatase PhoE